MTYSNGKKYVGQWQYDEKCGQGTMTWPSGRGYNYAKYVGRWDDDDMNGYGTVIFQPNLPWIKETGNFVDGTMRSGVLVRVNGTFKGTWDEDGNSIDVVKIK